MLATLCGFILSSYFNDPVRINIEGYFDLWDTTWRWGDTIQNELTQALIVGCHWPLALQDMDLDLRLAIRGRGKDLALASWNGCISFDQRCCHTTQRFHGECQRRDI